MAKAIDLDTVDAKRKAQLLARRLSKRQEYERKKDALLARNRVWREENPEKAASVAEAWRKANAERKAATTRKWQLKAVENMSDSYVKTNFAKKCAGLTSADVPPEVIQAARVSMLINRTLRTK